MPNRLTKGRALVGDCIPSSGNFVHVQASTVARTNTAAKTLFTLPAAAVIVRVSLYAATASDAGTTAIVTVGKLGGTGAEFMSQDVKTAAGVLGAGAILGTVGTAAVTVTATYAETGSASSTGGSWKVYLEYYLP